MVGGEAVSGIAIGVGCRMGCSAEAIEALVRRALADTPRDTQLGIFTIVDKQGESGLSKAAQRLGFDLNYVPREALRSRETDIQNRSPAAERAFGVPSVAEAAALFGAGPGSVLVVPRVAADGATCAIARAVAP
jgi:cobalt-precorrin 5A hydrolase